MSNCKYRIDGFKPILYLYDRVSTLVSVVVDNADDQANMYVITSQVEEPDVYLPDKLDYKETETLNGRYRFERTLTVRFSGYLPWDNVDHYFVLEGKDGVSYLLNYEHLPEVSYKFVLSRGEYYTEVVFHFLSNYPLLSSSTPLSFSGECHSYSVQNGSIALHAKCHESAFLDDYNQKITLADSFDFFEVDGDGISLTEEKSDSGLLTWRIEYTLPLDDSSDVWNMFQFECNRYNFIVDDGDGQEFYVGFENGLQGSYEISDGKYTVTYAGSGYLPMSYGKYAIVSSTSSFWRYIKDLDLCVAKGYACYRLQEQLDIAGNPTGFYRCLEGYEDFFIHLGYNIDGSFTNPPVYRSERCTTSPCGVSFDRATIYFDGANTADTIYVNAGCEWTIRDIPSWLTLSSSSGTGDSAITITCTAEWSSTARLTLVSSDGSMDYLTVIADEGKFIQDWDSVDARQQSLVYNAIKRFTVTSADVQCNAYGMMLTVSIPANETNSARTFTINMQSVDGEQVTLEILQDQLYIQWRDVTGLLCESGNTYHRQQKYIAYTPDGTYTPTNEFRIGSLIVSEDLCSGYYQKWEQDGYLCYDGDLYNAMKLYVSTDNTNWNYTGEMALGELEETNSSDCQNLLGRWYQTYKTACASE